MTNPDRKPHVSIIIPVFNDQAGIDACLNALEQQDYPKSSFDVVVVDNASDEPIQLGNTAAVDAQTVTCSKAGAYSARNRGIIAARGDVLAFTDADCLPRSDWLSEGVAALTATGARVLVGGQVEVTPSQKPTAVELYQSITGFMQRENIEQRGFSATANLFAWRENIDAIGPFDEDLLSGGDREFAWRAACAGIPTHFAPAAIVETAPRMSLAAAIRQARRVAGGRRTLRKAESAINKDHLKPGRNAWQSAFWLLTHPELRIFDRARVFSVASVIYFAQAFELMRLCLGGTPERQ